MSGPLSTTDVYLTRPRVVHSVHTRNFSLLCTWGSLRTVSLLLVLITLHSSVRAAGRVRSSLAESGFTQIPCFYVKAFFHGISSGA